ncbi:MAG: cysteine hydrolase [Alphaproteobacteria bacterium]|nr:cysteine hydrolase [Alphaproteobacteria bacterium]
MVRPHADTVLLLIDLQRAFCDSDGSMSRQGRDISAMREAARTCARLAAAARAATVPVIWTRMGFRPGYADGGRLVWNIRPALREIDALRLDTPDCEITHLAAASEHDIIIEKPRYSAVYATPLEAILRSLGTSRIIVGGVTTSMCVDTTVRDLSQRDHDVLLASDACGDFDPARHDAAIAAMEFGFCRIVAAQEALDIISSSSQRAT